MTTPQSTPSSPGSPPASEPAHVDLTRPEPGQAEAKETPQLPHERDQSVDMTDGERRPEVEQAARDLKRGLKDTDWGPALQKAARDMERK